MDLDPTLLFYTMLNNDDMTSRTECTILYYIGVDVLYLNVYEKHNNIIQHNDNNNNNNI